MAAYGTSRRGTSTSRKPARRTGQMASMTKTSDNMELGAQLDEIEESFRTCDAQLEANVNRLGRIVGADRSHGRPPRSRRMRRRCGSGAAAPAGRRWCCGSRVTHAALADRTSRASSTCSGWCRVAAQRRARDRRRRVGILTDAHHFLFYDAPFAPRSPSGDLDSQSSGAESGDGRTRGATDGRRRRAAERAPRPLRRGRRLGPARRRPLARAARLQNVEHLPQQRRLRRLRRTPRPPADVALGDALPRAPPPQARARPPPLRPRPRARGAAAARALAAVAGLPNESLKGEDRRTISEVGEAARVAPPRGAPPRTPPPSSTDSSSPSPTSASHAVGGEAPKDSVRRRPPPPPPPRPPPRPPAPRAPSSRTPAPAAAAGDAGKEMIAVTIRRHEYAAASTGDAARAQHGGRGVAARRASFPSKGWPTAGRRRDARRGGCSARRRSSSSSARGSTRRW